MEWKQSGFSIVLMEEDTIKLFGTALHTYRLNSVNQDNCKPRLICNSIEEPDDITPSVNGWTENHQQLI